ncbi:Chitin deacetylase [Colletotrichum orbiculare MAFF 240422]|uniref:Chitin deacetylase n=1 Tax=Colletotrichum orbiculare (strain 104-T / ATCC 96160 / CBS 514.97 / LARS 414 / MAFF 240422) TaxID=1213857 RepID=A0A484G294_COLOR|nr:Chitin deacetylase [Colletotrichum orbiculare MAFF 240422]
MHWSPLLLATLAGLEVAYAHDEPHMNIVLGRRGVDELRRKRATYESWNPPSAPMKPRDEAPERLVARQTGPAQALPSGITVGDGIQCGPGFGACTGSNCCSSAGWCGVGTDYCRAPDCQISYGPGCDGNQRPNGPDTSNDARPLLGTVPYGGLGIYACVNDGDVAITYDDGPYIYTEAMLDAFKAHGAVATWYITGNNIGKGMINVNYRSLIQRMVAEGHQIASHTWSHENLDQMTLSQRKNQMVFNEIAFTDILGFYPTYMRPPFSICGSECQKQMVDLGYHITYFDLDTQGYLHTDPSQIGVSLGIWDAAMVARSPCNASYLHIEHDIHQQIAQVLTPHILDSIVANGWKAVTVGECLADPPENWYRRANPGYNFNITAVSPAVCTSTASKTTSTRSSTSRSTASSTALAISTNAQCGGTTGLTCLGSAFGNCCSVNGWCGSTSSYCGTGCQSQFGSCGSQSSSASGSSSASAAGSSSRTGTASSAQASSTLPVSTNGECGSGNGRTCQGSGFGNCCSPYNYCGNTDGHCGTGCQSIFGTCTSSSSSGALSASSSRASSAAASSGASSSRASSASASGSRTAGSALPSSTLPVSDNGECATNGRSCIGYSGGSCCSQYNYCGSTDGHCGTGCQSGFGTCGGSVAGSSSAAAAGSSSAAAGSASASARASSASSVRASGTASASASTNTNPSTNGECGGTRGFNCLGTNFGDCCSPYNYCGNTTAHCDTGCQSGFGRCSGTGVNLKVSLDGACGNTNGNTGSETCQGSAFGNCCSAYGYCGSTTGHCGTGCQSQFGTCGN